MTRFAGIAYFVGIFLIASGLILRWIAIFQLKRFFTMNVSIAEDHQLIQSGLYAHVRHPSYTGALVSFLGLGLAYANWASVLVIFVPVLGAFLYRIKVEEEALTSAFGDQYREYAARSRRLIPFVY